MTKLEEMFPAYYREEDKIFQTVEAHIECVRNKSINNSYEKEAQHYMVNVYENAYKELASKKAIVHDEESGILILRKEFYDEEIGVITEGKLMEVMIGF